MIPVGMAVVFGGYAVGVLAYCWLRGYNVTFMNLWALTWPAKGKAAPAAAAGAPAGTV
jgi:hypothetical protein